MEWLTAVRKTIDYIEENLDDRISAQDAADQVYLSPYFLQKGFSLITGYGFSEYVRSRRLYQAALDLKNTDDRIIDIALRWGWETPESFTKAFTRFHGVSPRQVRSGAAFRTFLPLTIHLAIQGGNQMEFTVKSMFGFRLIGFQRIFDSDTSYREIPKFWDEIREKYGQPEEPADPYAKAVADYGIGEYGVCIDDIGEGRFRYLIAGKYTGGEVPDGMVVYEFPRGDWAVFNCIGPLPDAFQSMNTRIFREWLPGNPDYELCGNGNVEWYDCINGKTTDPDYRSAIWIPVRKKQ